MPANTGTSKKLPPGIVDVGFDIDPLTCTDVWCADEHAQAAGDDIADDFNNETTNRS